MTMKILATTALGLAIVLFTPSGAIGQTNCTGDGGYATNGNEIPCGDINFPCCTVWDACNGPYSGCNNYDQDFNSTGGCDLSCTPIDSGVLFLLLGGAAFGGMMIMRRRQEALEVIKH